jgi:hypothetical protein
MTRRRIGRTIDTKRIEDPWTAAADEHVPEMECLVPERIETYRLHRLETSRRIEEEYHDLGRCL